MDALLRALLRLQAEQALTIRELCELVRDVRRDLAALGGSDERTGSCPARAARKKAPPLLH